MKIKHFIVSRFLSYNFNHSNEELFSKEWLKKAFNLTVTHIIPTLENQTNKNFELIFSIHNDIPEEKIKFLYDLKSEYFKITVLRSRDISKYMRSFYKNHTHIIVTRMDYDDLIYKDAVDLVQKSVHPDTTFKIYGFLNGATCIDKEHDCYLFTQHYTLDGDGFFSIFESIIINTEYKKIPCNIYTIGKHCDAKHLIVSHKDDWGITEFDNDWWDWCKTKEVRYIWIRHKFSQSYLQDKTLHRSTIPVKVNLKEDFGYIY